MPICFLAILTTIVVLLEVYLPVLVARSIDAMVGKNYVNFTEITQIVGKIVIFTVVVFAMQWLNRVINDKIIFSMAQTLRNEAIEKLQKVPISYVDKHQQGEIVSRVISDVDQITDGLILGFSQGFSGFLTIVVIIFFMFSIHYQMAWLVVILSPLSLGITNYISKKTYQLFQKQSESRAQETAFLQERIGNQKTVIAFGEEEHSQRIFEKINNNLGEVSLKAMFFSSITNPSTRFCNNVIYAIVAFFGAFLAIAGDLTIGGLTCFLSYATQYTKPFNEISGVLAELQNALVCLERCLEIIEAEEETDEKKEELKAVKGKMELRDVVFGYEKGKILLNHLKVSMEAGKKVAIVGPTGCGKTTLINLFMRFYDVNAGEILLDDQNIQEMTRKSLRKWFGMVLQDSWMKKGSIRENIMLGNPEATEQEMIKATKKAMCYDLIQKLPKGFDTIIKNHDGMLSAGEKQLISIARILLRNPPMLILDEATSNLDTRTEAKLQKAFDEVMKGRTSFVVAHRLSTIVTADVIWVMKQGMIIETGNHKELMEKNGFYAELYQSQFEKENG